jgi:hypothetical protein
METLHRVANSDHSLLIDYDSDVLHKFLLINCELSQGYVFGPLLFTLIRINLTL